jgi:Flp pilus assembly protein TadG
MNILPPPLARLRGVATVEFALVCFMFLLLVFGALEFARVLYIHNTLQEVTRRAAREMTVRWIDDEDTAKTLALFGAASLPGGAEITKSSIVIEYLNSAGSAVTTVPADPGDNLSACGDAARVNDCIYSVRVSIADDVYYSPMVSMIQLLPIKLPRSTVTMHAESMGFEH